MDIYSQITNYCDCEHVTEKDVDELIDLVSIATCWTQEPCETFLKSERREIIDLPDCMDDCDVYEFEPFYYPFDPESMSFKLVEINGIDEEISDIDSFRFSEITDSFKLLLPIPSCECGCDACGCPTKYKLVATYMAGYEGVPECLLPLFCAAVHWIDNKNDCDCDCVPCKEDDNEEATGMKYYFLEILEKMYIKQLGLISLCNRSKRYGFLGRVI